MDIGLVFDEYPNVVLDLGSGYSNVHTNIAEIEVDETVDDRVVTKTKFSADVFRVSNEQIEKYGIEYVLGNIEKFDVAGNPFSKFVRSKEENK